MSEIDSYLYRKILPGHEFENLIPKSKCIATNAGVGYTDHSINVMLDCINNYSWQMKKVAEKIKKRSLKKCAQSVFDFIYNHFQYKADDELQKLRSPSCSWHERYKGIDCKSYSILASCILHEMGINHYIRKIIQPGSPEMSTDERKNFERSFSHVYVIVPIDQENNTLSQGYYVVDGTVRNNEEPIFLKSKDEFMQGLPHVMMNKPNRKYKNGLGDPITYGGIKDGITNEINKIDVKAISTKLIKDKFLSKLSLSNIFGFLKIPINCWGGSAYSESELTRDIKEIEAFSVDTLNAMNDALQANNMQLFNDKVNWFFGITAHTKKRMAAKKAQGWNKCSTEKFTAAQLALTFWETVVAKALDAWLDKSFYSTPGAIVTYDTAKRYLAKSPMQWGAGGSSLNSVSVSLPYETFTKKDPSTQIPSFPMTDYVYSMATKPSSFDPAAYLDDIKDLYNVIQNPLSILTPTMPTTPVATNPTIPATTTGNQNTTANPNTAVTPKPTVKPLQPTTQQAGFGVLGWLLIAGGVAVAFKMGSGEDNLKSKKQTA